MRNKPIGVLGGTFDPIHYGHLRPALEIWENLNLAEIRFIPGSQPPHRDQPTATPAQRLTMLELAITDQPGFIVDDRELHREGPSYTVDTLTSLRTEVDRTPLCLILGMDAFDDFHHWHRWQEIPLLAHLLVLHRPGAQLSFSDALGELVARHKLHHYNGLVERPAGGVLFYEVTQLDISATQIRELITHGKSPRYLLPETVRTYIQDQRLYQSSSSTSIDETQI